MPRRKPTRTDYSVQVSKSGPQSLEASVRPRGMFVDAGDDIAMQLEKQGDNFRVAPAGLSLLLNNVQSLFDRVGMLIRPGARERIVDISDLEHARE